jgi:hypothetical protein
MYWLAVSAASAASISGSGWRGSRKGRPTPDCGNSRQSVCFGSGRGSYGCTGLTVTAVLRPISYDVNLLQPTQTVSDSTVLGAIKVKSIRRFGSSPVLISCVLCVTVKQRAWPVGGVREWQDPGASRGAGGRGNREAPGPELYCVNRN